MVDRGQNYVTDEDPGFVDLEEMDFRLTEQAHQRLYEQVGINQIPFERIGCYESEERASWPVPSRRRPTMFEPDPIDVPLAEDAIEVDGDPSDWEDIAWVPSRYQPEGGSFKLCWRPEGLYGLVRALDGTIEVNAGMPWVRGDCVVVLVDPTLERGLRFGPHTLGFMLNIRPDIGVFGGPAQITYWDHTRDYYPTVTWIGEDDGGIVSAWKPFPEGYLYGEQNQGYVVEYFVPVARLAPAQMETGAVLGFSSGLADDQVGVEATYNPEHPGSARDLPVTWGRIRLVSSKQ
jgi:hypothetical protein